MTDLNTNDRAIKFMRALGANVVVIRKQDSNGGYLQSRIEYIQQRMVTDPKLVWLNQYSNPANITAHDRYTAAEIVEHFGVPDWLFRGCQHFGHADGMPAAPACQRATDPGGRGGRGSAPCSLEASPDDAGFPALAPVGGQSCSSMTTHNRKICIPELETIRMCRRIAREYGLLLGGSTGTVLAAVARYQEEIRFGSRVLAISPDLGGGYLDTIYDDAWVLERFGEDALGPAGRFTSDPAAHSEPLAARRRHGKPVRRRKRRLPGPGKRREQHCLWPVSCPVPAGWRAVFEVTPGTAACDTSKLIGPTCAH